MITQEKGRIAENNALAYLVAQGLKPITQNYHCKLGEIDLIMRDGEHIVFVEVRSRISMAFGGGIGSITYAKQQKIIRSATYYLMTHKEWGQLAPRFDVISIDGKEATITWLKNAFDTN